MFGTPPSCKRGRGKSQPPITVLPKAKSFAAEPIELGDRERFLVISHLLAGLEPIEEILTQRRKDVKKQRRGKDGFELEVWSFSGAWYLALGASSPRFMESQVNRVKRSEPI
jgi:hypothetical protein